MSIGVKTQNVTLVTVMRVHISHLSDVEDLQTTIVRDCVKLLILAVKADSSNGISMADESLNLLLVVDVPYSHNSVFSA